MNGRRPLRLIAVLFGVLALMVLAARCRAAGRGPAGDGTIERLRAEVIAAHRHDPAAFTQGLIWHDHRLLESTGRYGASELREVDIETGTVLRSHRLDDDLFGEGLARVDDRLVQLTWREGRALVYRLDDLRPIDEWAYDGEGWGLCYDGRVLWMSDGTDRLVARDPESFVPLRQLTVTVRGRPLDRINELECAEGWLYANVFGTDQIVRIDPATGAVRAVIDAATLLTPQEREAADVLNGIAYHPQRETFFLTGKYWPRLFEVSFRRYGE